MKRSEAKRSARGWTLGAFAAHELAAAAAVVLRSHHGYEAFATHRARARCRIRFPPWNPHGTPHHDYGGPLTEGLIAARHVLRSTVFDQILLFWGRACGGSKLFRKETRRKLESTEPSARNILNFFGSEGFVYVRGARSAPRSGGARRGVLISGFVV